MVVQITSSLECFATHLTIITCTAQIVLEHSKSSQISWPCRRFWKIPVSSKVTWPHGNFWNILWSSQVTQLTPNQISNSTHVIECKQTNKLKNERQLWRDRVHHWFWSRVFSIVIVGSRSQAFREVLPVQQGAIDWSYLPSELGFIPSHWQPANSQGTWDLMNTWLHSPLLSSVSIKLITL